MCLCGAVGESESRSDLRAHTLKCFDVHAIDLRMDGKFMKKYQVFVSSTFDDLKGARQAVSGALLRAGCFPAGMELFPAADEEQLSFIKKVIAQSDYYLLILAGKYGSIDPKTDESYTEQEYNFAISIKKPIIRLVHRDPFGLLPKNLLEATDRGIERLHRFRQRVMESSLVRQWETDDELMFEAVMALDDAKLRNPATGWVRGDEIKKGSIEAQDTIEKLKAEIELLKGKSTDLRFEFVDRCIKKFDLGSREEILSKVAEVTTNRVVFEGDLRRSLEADGLSAEAADAINRALVLDNVTKIRTTGEVTVPSTSKRYLEELLFDRLM